MDKQNILLLLDLGQPQLFLIMNNPVSFLLFKSFLVLGMVYWGEANKHLTKCSHSASQQAECLPGPRTSPHQHWKSGAFGVFASPRNIQFVGS